MDLAHFNLFSTFGVRDIVILVIGVVAVYLLVALLRLSQIRRPGKSEASLPSFSAASDKPRDAADETRPATTRIDNVESSTPMVPLFEYQLFRNQVEAELAQLRQELASLHESIAQLSVTRRMSPQYNEAMQLAQRGASARLIAEQCAISLGEAELVAALGRDQQNHQPFQDRPQESPYHDPRYPAGY
ncbi:MAG: DUF2802 domain-containing protein [Sterolibacterium sp.]|nr:DUF2802 domain-containing protein [Sterolibacterium sp.]